MEKIDVKKGIDSLKQAVESDCSSNNQHDYQKKYDWVIERAKHYAERTGKTMEDILEIWENDRSYWYMNYYQDCNQPMLDSKNVVMYDDWIKSLREHFGDDAKKWKFKCPSCGGIQSIQDFLDHNVDSPEGKVYFSCIGRYVKNVGCDWTLGGLLRIHELSVMKDAKVFPVFETAVFEELLNKK